MIKKLANIGNSYGVIIDRPMLKEAGIGPHVKVEVTVEDGAVVVRPVSQPGSEQKSRRKSAHITSR